MKYLMILGGLLGFGIGLIFGWIQESSWPSILWRASVAAYVAGLLLRWWGRIWMQGLRQAHLEQAAARTQAKTSAPANSAFAKS